MECQFIEKNIDNTQKALVEFKDIVIEMNIWIIITKEIVKSVHSAQPLFLGDSSLAIKRCISTKKVWDFVQAQENNKIYVSGLNHGVKKPALRALFSQVPLWIMIYLISFLVSLVVSGIYDLSRKMREHLHTLITIRMFVFNNNWYYSYQSKNEATASLVLDKTLFEEKMISVAISHPRKPTKEGEVKETTKMFVPRITKKKTKLHLW